MPTTDTETFTRDEAIRYFDQLCWVFRQDYSKNADDAAKQRAVTLQAFAALGITEADIVTARGF